jgi:nucleotide-binding universal stress UspA family protein
VLLATDGSDLAATAMVRAVALFGPDARYVTVAVNPPAFAPAASVTPMETHPTLVDPDLREEIEASERVESEAEVAALDATLGIVTEHLVETGEPGPVICEVAARIEADVVVVGSHGHGWLQRVVLGSVSTHVSHHAPCPVLVVRPDPDPDPSDGGQPSGAALG